MIGAGTMGAGIADWSARSGLRTLLYDIDPGRVSAALTRITERSQRPRTGSETPVEESQRPTLPAAATDLGAAVKQSDFIIEAIVEDITRKVELFAALGSLAPDGTVLATNTSALSVTEMGAASEVPSRVVGMHFFNPVARMQLVEVVRGLETSDETVEACLALARSFGKEPIVISESPGGAVSRINAMIGNEAFYMLMEGVASAADIDRALKLGLNHPMGPFELGDVVGWDIRLKVLEHLHATLGEKFRPCPLMVKFVKAGRLGRKTGRGVFTYASGGGKA